MPNQRTFESDFARWNQSHFVTCLAVSVCQVNGQKVIDLTCAEVVPLIAESGAQLDLVVSRRPTDTQQQNTADSLPACSSAVTAGGHQQSLVDRKHLKEDNV